MIQESDNPRNALSIAIPATLALLSFIAYAQDAGPSASRPALSTGFRFAEMTGEELFANVCQGCHMPDAKGAVGAGMYPALAKNEKLETAGYPVGVVVKGQKAMPPLGPYFSDAQIADVVNYIRTHFGNKYKDKVKPEDVKLMR
jgi:mono/diheme cytochrome c family protein